MHQHNIDFNPFACFTHKTGGKRALHGRVALVQVVDRGVMSLICGFKSQIQYIWQRVAEDYSPFDVDVTTEAPSSIATLVRSSIDDTVFGVTVRAFNS